MLIIQDIHVVRGREELPFEDRYRTEIAPALQGIGAQLLYFGWAPHGAGQGYEAIVLTALKDADALHAYQENLRIGDLSEVWAKIEGAHHFAESRLLVTVGPMPTPSSTPVGDGPRSLFRLDTIKVAGSVMAAAETVADSVTSNENDVFEPLGVFAPAMGDLEAAEITVFSRVRSFELFRTALEDLDSSSWPGMVSAPGEIDRSVRISRCTTFSPIH